MDMPKYTPIPGTGGWSLKAAEKTIELQHSQIREKWEIEADKVIWKTFPHLMKWIIKPEELSKLDESIRANNAATSDGMKKVLETRARVEAAWDQNRANYSAVSERTAETFKGNKVVLDNIMKDKQIFWHDAEILSKYLQKEQLSDTDRAKAYQLLQQKFNGSSSSSTPSGAAVSWFSAGRIGTSDWVNITLNWTTPITVRNVQGKDDVVFSTEDFRKEVEWKTGIVDRASFISSLMAWNAITKQAAESIAKKIEELNPQYFTAPSVAAAKKANPPPASAQPQAANPPNP